jgi:predicted PurR-regulated permease PerM
MKMPFSDPHPFFQGWRASKVALATVAVVSVAVSFWLVFRLQLVLFAFFIALVISTAINPAVIWLHRRGLPRSLGVILIYLLIILLFAGFVWLIGPLILDQVAGIFEVLPAYYHQFRNWFLDSPSFLIRMIGVRLPQDLFLTQLSQPALIIDPDSVGTEGNGAEVAIRQQIAQALTYAVMIIRYLFIGLAVILLAFYWTLDGQRTLRYWLLLVNQKQRENIRGIVEEIESKVGGYVRGVFLLSLIVGAMALVAYWIIGLPYALPLAILAGVFEAVPIVGPALGALPALTIALGMGNDSLVIGVIIATLIIQVVENYILAPRILGHSVGVNPVVTLLALVAFTSLLGFAGALLAIPLAAVFQIILDRVLLKPDTLKQDIVQGRDRISVLRARLHELTTDLRQKVKEKEGETGEIEDQVEDVLERIAFDLDRVLDEVTQRSSSNQGDSP